MANVTQQDIEQSLRALGLQSGDIVLLHSSLASLGRVEGGADTVVDAFLSVLGPEGTLVVPTFGTLGIVPDTVKARPEAVHSAQPVASVAAIGAQAEEICRDHWKAELAHTQDTPYVRIADLGGYVCLLGVDQDRNTTLHTAEELLRLPYLTPTPEKTFQTPQGQVTKSWPLFPGPHRNFIGLDRLLRESERMRMGRIGNAVVRLIKSRDLIELARDAGARDPAFVLCDNPHCADCVAQRAALRRDRLDREAFTLVASATLAGRYPEEIADACRAAGVDAVELDALRGRPLCMHTADELARAAATLRSAGLRVYALRVWAVGSRIAPLLEQAAATEAERVVVPLTAWAGAHAAEAAQRRVRISFFNAGLAAAGASALLLGLREEGFEVGFTFRAAEFARAGEKPFLESYKHKLRRFVDGLDLEDACFDGTPQPLGQGNAEVKEMISILRAASFPGAMVLGPGNRVVGTLHQAAERFEHLLDTM